MSELDRPIAIVGLGYVGLPLAVEFGKYRPTIGYDQDAGRIEGLARHFDRTQEVTQEELAAARFLRFAQQPQEIASARIYILTVPTPVDSSRRPDLSHLIAASRQVGGCLSRGDLVIYESTVYPGCTEEVCVPLLEKHSGLRRNQDFTYGYSPERINPGDKQHRLAHIKKITSGSTPEAAQAVDQLYAEIISAGTHPTSSIEVAEAAKVIENAQRDLNIAFVNELAVIFDRMGLDTLEVLKASGTKWNFMPFRPGLVGGHCLGVDPYYLTYKAETLGYHPEVLLAGRRINDTMGIFVANKVVKLMIHKRHRVFGARALALGITFKENCPDIRNSRSVDVIRELQDYGMTVEVYDPWADPESVYETYGLRLAADPTGVYDCIVLTVAHQVFQQLDYHQLSHAETIRYDVKSFLPKEIFPHRL